MNDTTWFWKIVDARGLADVSSDEIVALNELVDRAERCKAAERKLPEAIEALSECEEYFHNRADADCDQDGFIPNKEMLLLSVVRTALQALENGPAGLADATSNPPLSDLSSLRKGSEEIEALVTQVEDVVLTDWFRHTSDPEASRRVVVRAVVKRTLAALVSGSREDGA